MPRCLCEVSEVLNPQGGFLKSICALTGRFSDSLSPCLQAHFAERLPVQFNESIAIIV